AGAAARASRAARFPVRDFPDGCRDGHGGAGAGRLLRSSRPGGAAQARRQLGHGRGPALDEGETSLARGGDVVSGVAGEARGAAAPDREGRNLHGLGQGGVRGDGLNLRARGGDRGSKRTGAPARFQSSGANGRGGCRGKRVAGGSVQIRQDADVRLVRRPGHEEDGRPGGSGRGARGPAAGAGGSPLMIQLFRVCKEYGRFRHALTDVTCSIERGEFVFLTGPSGAGKSTFLKLLFRAEPPTSGQILVNGRNIGVLPDSQVPYFRRTVGVVFQDFKLIARKTVFENIAFVQSVLGLPRAEQKRRAYQVLKRVGL